MWSPSLGSPSLTPKDSVPPRFSAVPTSATRPRFGATSGENDRHPSDLPEPEGITDTFETKHEAKTPATDKVSLRNKGDAASNAVDSLDGSDRTSESQGKRVTAKGSVSKTDATSPVRDKRTSQTPKATEGAPDWKLRKAVTFSTVIPILSSLLWMGGPILGVGVGVPIAYLSGIYGRRLHAGVDTEKINDSASMIDKGIAAFLKMKNSSPEKVAMEMKQIFGSGPVTDAVAWLSNGRIGKLAPVKWLLGHYNDMRKLENLEKGARATSKAFKILDRLSKGFAVNLAVSKESNPFKAAFAGAKAFIEVALAWFFLPFEAIGWFKDHKKSSQPGANPA